MSNDDYAFDFDQKQKTLKADQAGLKSQRNEGELSASKKLIQVLNTNSKEMLPAARKYKSERRSIHLMNKGNAVQAGKQV